MIYPSRRDSSTLQSLCCFWQTPLQKSVDKKHSMCRSRSYIPRRRHFLPVHPLGTTWLRSKWGFPMMCTGWGFGAPRTELRNIKKEKSNISTYIINSNFVSGCGTGQTVIRSQCLAIFFSKLIMLLYMKKAFLWCYCHYIIILSVINALFLSAWKNGLICVPNTYLT